MVEASKNQADAYDADTQSGMKTHEKDESNTDREVGMMKAASSESGSFNTDIGAHVDKDRP